MKNFLDPSDTGFVYYYIALICHFHHDFPNTVTNWASR